MTNKTKTATPSETNQAQGTPVAGQKTAGPEGGSAADSASAADNVESNLVVGLPLEKVAAIVSACHARLGRPLAPHDLEEATQEVRVTGWMKQGDFRGDSSAETWLYGIARLCILRQLSKTRKIASREVAITPATRQPTDPGIGPGSRFDTGLQVAVRRCLSQDGDTMESIVRSHDVDGATFREIANDLGMTEPAVKSRYHRSLPDLRRRLQKFWLDAVR